MDDALTLARSVLALPEDADLADLLAPSETAPSLDDAVVAALRAHPDAFDTMQPTQDITRALTADTVAGLYRAWQYLDLDAEALRALEALHAESLTRLGAGLARGTDVGVEAGRVRCAHLEALGALLSSLPGVPALSALEAQRAAGPVTCSAYPAELQLRVLGLRADRLMEPVLDLGCGADAALVAHLRDRGLDATGVDRLVTPGPGRVQASWSAFDPGDARWGTIVSHQALSLHLIQAHLGADMTKARALAQRIIRLLDALKPGGTLAYAPGLPFLEPVLDRRRYLVQQRALPEAVTAQAPPALRALFAPRPLHATAILKRPLTPAS